MKYLLIGFFACLAEFLFSQPYLENMKKRGTALRNCKLRYFPGLHLSASRKQLALDQLEFNFIELIVYPQRSRYFRQMNDSPEK